MSRPALHQDAAETPVQLGRDLLLLLARKRLSETAQNVLLLLLAHHDPDTGMVKASQKEIAEVLGVHRQAVNAAFKILTEEELVHSEGRSRYRLSTLFLPSENTAPLRSPEPEYRAFRLAPAPPERRPRLRAVPAFVTVETTRSSSTSDPRD